MAAGRTVLAVYLYPDRRSGFRQYRDGTGRVGGAEPGGTGTYPVTKFRNCFLKEKEIGCGGWYLSVFYGYLLPTYLLPTLVHRYPVPHFYFILFY